MTATPAAPAARPAFEPLNALEQLLVAAARGGADQRAAFEAAVPDHPLWAVQLAAPGGAADVVRLRTETGPDGRPATAVFTARERALEALGPDADAVSWPGRDLLAAIQENPAVLNPGLGYGVRWDAAAIAGLLGRPTPPRRERMPTLVAAPAETPEGLVAGLSAAFAAEPAIKAAWLALAHWADGEQGFLLDVRTASPEVSVPVLMNRALAGVALDARLDVVVGSPAEAPGKGLEIVAPRA